MSNSDAITSQDPNEFLSYSDEDGNRVPDGRVVFSATDAGSTNTRIITVRNDHIFPIQFIEPFTTDPRMRIVDHPNILESGAEGAIKLQYFPPKNEIMPMIKAGWGFSLNIIVVR